jgi:hypothetical protein
MATARPPDREKKSAEAEHQLRLDRELDETFPASDPPSMTQPGTKLGAPERKSKDPKPRQKAEK